MIKAYDEDLFQAARPGEDLHAYIRDTVVAASPHAVKAAVVQYLIEHDPAVPVYQLMNRIIAEGALLAKARVVSDRKWRNCVVLVTPAEAAVTQGGITRLDGTCDMEATLRYWRLHAEAIYIQLAPGPVAEKTLGESMEYLLNWTFKRYFQRTE